MASNTNKKKVAAKRPAAKKPAPKKPAPKKPVAKKTTNEKVRDLHDSGAVTGLPLVNPNPETEQLARAAQQIPDGIDFADQLAVSIAMYNLALMNCNAAQQTTQNLQVLAQQACVAASALINIGKNQSDNVVPREEYNKIVVELQRWQQGYQHLNAQFTHLQAEQQKLVAQVQSQNTMYHQNQGVTY